MEVNVDFLPYMEVNVGKKKNKRHGRRSAHLYVNKKENEKKMTKHGLVLSSKLVSKTSDIYTNLCLLN